MNQTLRAAFDDEWRRSELARFASDWDLAFRHLERAHILGQRQTRLHVKCHLGMWRVGWLRGDWRELAGQSTRLIAAILFSRVWVPIGNTGGANVSAFVSMAVPDDLQAVLRAPKHAAGPPFEP